MTAHSEPSLPQPQPGPLPRITLPGVSKKAASKTVPPAGSGGTRRERRGGGKGAVGHDRGGNAARDQRKFAPRRTG